MSAQPPRQLARPQTPLRVEFAELSDYFLADLLAYANGPHQLPIFVGLAIFASDGMPQVHINRKSLLYKTGVEYGDYTINHVEGCSHGCMYPCYAMLMAKRFGRVKNYDEWIKPKIVSNAIELLEQEIPKHKDKIKST